MRAIFGCEHLRVTRWVAQGRVRGIDGLGCRRGGASVMRLEKSTSPTSAVSRSKGLSSEREMGKSLHYIS